MKNTFAILFHMDRSKTNESGLCVIRCRIICNGTSSSFSTQLQTSPDEWLAQRGCIKATIGNSSGVNLQLDSIEECLHSLYEHTLRKGNYITTEYLKERYMQQSHPMPTLTGLYQSACEYEEELQGRTLSKATIRAFKDSYKSFVHFLQIRDRVNCMPIGVDKTLLEDYRLFMLRDLGNKESSVSNRLRHLHWVIRKVLQERYVREDPFELINIEAPTYERNVLTADDLQKFLACRPHHSTDNHCRLIFLLGYFTGLAFPDLRKLQMDGAYTFGSGRRYISLCRTETRDRDIVSLLPAAEKILAIVSHGRREGLLSREFPGNSNFDRTIQEIYIRAELPPHTRAASHTARHTFVTAIRLENGLPIETVSKVLGRRFISTTGIYARVTESKIAREMQPLVGSEHTRVLHETLRLCPSRTSEESSPIVGV